MSTCYLLLGTNLGDKSVNLQQATQYISADVGQVLTCSSVYRTAAWGKQDQQDFYNQVLMVETAKSASATLSTCLEIEKRMGRVRFEQWGERLIDIDILYFDDLIQDTEGLQVPHPEIQNRRFTLVPLAELASEFAHPVLHKTNQELLDECSDSLQVVKI